MRLVAFSTLGEQVVCPNCDTVFHPGAFAVETAGDATGRSDDFVTRSHYVEPTSPTSQDCLRPAEEPGEIGRLGPYRVLEVLGHGGMGLVYLAEDPKLKRQIALKVMLAGHAAKAQARERFLREAQAQAALEHDHVVAIYQVGEENGVPFLAMPLLRGETLAQRLKRDRKLPLPDVLRIGGEIAEGLAAAHERRLIHRDIKPGNIWLETYRTRVKILDFGLARTMQTSDGATITRAGVIVGTPAYMSPEQARGETVDARSDLFSLGIVLYQMATGELPFKGPNTVAILTALAVNQPIAPCQLCGNLPVGVSDTIIKLLAKKPGERFQDAHEVATVLQKLGDNLAPTPMMEAVAPVETRLTPSSDQITPVIPPLKATATAITTKPPEPRATAAATLKVGKFGCLMQVTVACVVVGVGAIGLWIVQWGAHPSPAIVKRHLIEQINKFVDANPPDIDKAWGQVQASAKLGSPWQEDVREHFTDFTHNRIAELEKTGELKKATVTAKALSDKVNGDTTLERTKGKWHDRITAQIQSGNVIALAEIAEYQQVLPGEQLGNLQKAVWNCDKAIKAAESGKGKADDAFASLQALPDQAAQLRHPLYQRVADNCLSKGQFRPIFDAVKVAKLWPDATLYRTKAYDTLLLRLKTAAYNDLGEWELSKIYDVDLTETEKPKILEQVQSKYTRRMETWLNELPKKFPTDQGWRALLAKVAGLPTEYQELYQAKLKGGPDELLKFWKSIDALDKCLAEKGANPEPKEVFKHYVALLNATDIPASLDLDQHTRRVVELARENGAFDETLSMKIAARQKEFGLRPETMAMVRGGVPIAPLGQITKILTNVATLYGKGDFAECKKQLESVNKNAKDFKENRAKFDAFNALVHAQLVDTDVPRLVGAWKTLPAGDKTELGKHFAAVADKYLKDHWREAPAGDQKNGWRLRLDLCEASPPESSAVVAASALECRIELKEEAIDFPAAWQSLSHLLQKSPWPGEPQVGRAYSGYLKALAHAADKQKAAEALVEIKEALPQLPSDYRKQRAITMLADASPAAERKGSLDKQFKNSDALSAFKWLSVAEELANESKLRVDKERLIDLVLAAGNQPKLESASRDKMGALAEVLIADKDLFKDGALSKALYPLTMAYARLSDQPATVVRAYAELLDRLKAADRKEIGDLEFSREVLRKGIDLGRPSAKAPEDKANLARLIGEQADMILTDKADAEKLALWNKEFNGDALAEAQKLFAEASKLDSKNSIYRAGSQWLSGFSKLQSARLKENEAEKQAAYGTSISVLELALDSAKGLEPSQLLFLSRLYLDLHQAELEFGNYYWSLHYWLPKGYGANYDARSKMMARLNSALSYAQKAKEALNGAGDKAVDFEIQIHEALGKAHDGLANLAEVDHQQNFSKAQEQFNNAIDTLKSNRPTSWTGRGLVRYNWARFEKDKDAKTALLKKAEKDLIEANRLAGDGWEAIEPNYFLAKVYDDLDKLKIGRPHIYAKVMSLYDSLPAKPSESNFAQNTARHYVKEAVLRLSRPSTPQLETYARFMQGIDPSCAADLFLRHAAVSWQAAGKDVVTGLDKIAGANPGALESAVVVMRAKHVAKTYQDDQTKKIEIPEMERAKLLKQLRKNCKVAPDDYLRLWSRYTLAGVLYYSKEAKDADEACENYLEAKKIADELLRKHGTIEEIKEYRKWKSSNFKVWTDLDVNDWDRLFILYEDGANLLYALAVGKKRDEYLKEAASFVNAALNLMKRDHTERERVETLKRKIEADMRMK